MLHLPLQILKDCWKSGHIAKNMKVKIQTMLGDIVVRLYDEKCGFQLLSDMKKVLSWSAMACRKDVRD